MFLHSLEDCLGTQTYHVLSMSLFVQGLKSLVDAIYIVASTGVHEGGRSIRSTTGG